MKRRTLTKAKEPSKIQSPCSDESEESNLSRDQKQYLEERNILIKSEQEQSASFDKAILTLSAGALGLSITFMRSQTAPTTEKWAVLLSWSLLVLSMSATLISHLMSAKGCRFERERLDCLQEGKEYLPKLCHRFISGCIEPLNWIAVITFVAGAGHLAYFAYINL